MSTWRPHHRRTSSMPVSNEQLEELETRSVSIEYEHSPSFHEDDLDTTANSGMYIEEETETLRRQLTFTALKDHVTQFINRPDDTILQLCHSPTDPDRSVHIFASMLDLSTLSDTDATLRRHPVSSMSAGGSSSLDHPSSSFEGDNTCTLRRPPSLSMSNTPTMTKNLGSSDSSSTESLMLEDHRTLVLKEIVNTELKYITSLNELLHTFMPVFENIVGPRELRLMFPCQLEPLIECHKDFLKRLQERVSNGSKWFGIVGDIFGRFLNDKHIEVIALYNAYMHEFKVAMQTIAKYEHTSPPFRKALNECQQKSHGLTLQAFLLTPVQRLPRYELLLKAVLKHTPDLEDHPDSYGVDLVLKQLKTQLVGLDHSIQSCQLACSVTKTKTKSYSKRNSARKYKSSTRFSRLKRHLSQTNIDDYSSSPEQSPHSLRSNNFVLHAQHSVPLMTAANRCVSHGNLLTEGDSEELESISHAISCSDVSVVCDPMFIEQGQSSAEEEDTSANKSSSIHISHSSSSGCESGGSMSVFSLDDSQASVEADRRSVTGTTLPQVLSQSKLKIPSISNALMSLRKIGSNAHNSDQYKTHISDPIDFRHIQHGKNTSLKCA